MTDDREAHSPFGRISRLLNDIVSAAMLSWVFYVHYCMARDFFPFFFFVGPNSSSRPHAPSHSRPHALPHRSSALLFYSNLSGGESITLWLFAKTASRRCCRILPFPSIIFPFFSSTSLLSTQWFLLSGLFCWPFHQLGSHLPHYHIYCTYKQYTTVYIFRCVFRTPQYLLFSLVPLTRRRPI